jgi:3-oxoacyl-[acyl-carrier-protein] synthase II
VTPLGNQLEAVWHRLVNGESGVGPITLFDASNFPVRIAAEASEWSPESLPPCPESWTRMPRQTQFAVAASRDAWHAAGLAADASGRDPRRVGVSLGCGELFPDLPALGTLIGDALSDDGFDLGCFMREAFRAGCPLDEWALEPSTAVSCVAALLDAQGPCANLTTACVSSSIAIGEAAETIRRGDADVMLAGGAHSMIHPLGVTGFHRLSTLSTRNDAPRAASRPFEKHRDGFVVGEGGAVLVLESLESARQRGAEIWAELTGYGCTHDAYRFSDPRPDGQMAGHCILLALEDARRTRNEVDHVNAHGSGTPANDVAETRAIERAFGEHARRIAVSGTKSMTGHLTTACGALEFLFCVLAIRQGAVPPTINYEEADPECALDFVPNQARDMAVRTAVNNSFGFGGQNSVLVASAFED